MPGMVHATIVRPKVFGSKKLKVDASKLSDFAGAQLVENGDLVAVVHSDPEISKHAANSVQVTWDAPAAKANQETILQYLEDTIKDNEVFEKEGNLH